MTPYRRVLERKDISDDTKKTLREEHEALNPLELKRKFDMLKAELAKKLEDLKKKKTRTGNRLFLSITTP